MAVSTSDLHLYKGEEKLGKRLRCTPNLWRDLAYISRVWRAVRGRLADLKFSLKPFRVPKMRSGVRKMRFGLLQDWPVLQCDKEVLGAVFI